MTSTLLLLSILIGSSLTAPAPTGQVPSPIIIIPGDGGSQIWLKYNLSHTLHNVCPKKTDDFIQVWVDIKRLVRVWPFEELECTVHDLSLVYNETDHTTRAIDGIESKIPGWGETWSIEELAPSYQLVGHYFKNLVDTATKDWGYTRNVSIRGAPFDFRKAPNELGGIYKALTELIETAYAANGNKKVTLVGHSLGCSNALYFLNQQTQEWKDKYVARYVSINGPYGGTITALMATVSGYDFDEGKAILPPAEMRPLMKSLPSTAFMLPSNKFWSSNETLIKGPSASYGVGDYDKLYADLKQPTDAMMYHDTKDLIYDLTPPGVETHCLYSTGIQTVETLSFPKGIPNNQPDKTFGDGDGVVNLRSLKACGQWKGQQPQAVTERVFPNVKHFNMALEKDVIQYIWSLINGS